MQQTQNLKATTDLKQGFCLQLHRTPAIPVLRLCGSVTLENCADFEQGLLACAGQLTDDVVLDLTHLGFINIVGLGAIVRLGQVVRSKGGRAMLHGGNPSICKLMRILRLDEFFPAMDRVPAGPCAVADELTTCA